MAPPLERLNRTCVEFTTLRGMTGCPLASQVARTQSAFERAARERADADAVRADAPAFSLAPLSCIRSTHVGLTHGYAA